MGRTWRRKGSGKIGERGGGDEMGKEESSGREEG